jgi:DNA-binding transcriptional MerR regulator
MKTHFFAVKDIVRITGVTARTLHFYDKINLLKPTQLSDKGYRDYSIEDLERLQTILFLKEMDLPLKEISDIMQLSKEEQLQILKLHHQTLLAKQQRLGTIISALEDYVSGKEIINLNIFNNSPSSDEVQKLIVEWKSYLEQNMTCDAEILECIANTYKSDNRWKNYFRQFCDDDLTEFVYQAIMFYCKTSGK